MTITAPRAGPVGHAPRRAAWRRRGFPVSRVLVSIGLPTMPGQRRVRPVRCAVVDTLFVVSCRRGRGGRGWRRSTRWASGSPTGAGPTRSAAGPSGRPDGPDGTAETTGATVATDTAVPGAPMAVPELRVPNPCPTTAPEDVPGPSPPPASRPLASHAPSGAALVTGVLWAAVAHRVRSPPCSSTPFLRVPGPGGRACRSPTSPTGWCPAPRLRRACPHRPAAGGGVRRRPHLARPGRRGRSGVRWPSPCSSSSGSSCPRAWASATSAWPGSSG